MKIKLLLLISFTAFTLFSCTKEILDDKSIDNSSGDTNKEGSLTLKDIDPSIFECFGEDIVKYLQELIDQDAQTKANEHISVDPVVSSQYINPRGETFDIYARGTVASVEVRLKDMFEFVVYDSKTIVIDPLTQEGSTSLTAERNVSLTNESLMIVWEYKTPEMGTWQTFFVSKQEPLYINWTTNLKDLNYTIHRDGGDITISRGSSQYPQDNMDYIYFRVVDENDICVSDTLEIFGSFLPQGTLTVEEIDQNATNNRTLYVQRSIKPFESTQQTEWEAFDYGIQSYLIQTVIINKATIEGIIPSHKDSITIYLSSNDNFNGTQIRAISFYYNSSTPDTIVVDAIQSPVGTYDGYARMEIPAVGPNDGWCGEYFTNIAMGSTIGARWTFEYFNGEEWLNLTTKTQAEYYLSVRNEQISVGTAGGEWKLKVYGLFPEDRVIFRAMDENDTNVGVNSTYTVSENPGGSITPTNLTIQIQAGSGRQIYLWYQVLPEGTWRKWDATNVQASNWTYKLGSNYYITQ